MKKKSDYLICPVYLNNHVNSNYYFTNIFMDFIYLYIDVHIFDFVEYHLNNNSMTDENKKNVKTI